METWAAVMAALSRISLPGLSGLKVLPKPSRPTSQSNWEKCAKAVWYVGHWRASLQHITLCYFSLDPPISIPSLYMEQYVKNGLPLPSSFFNQAVKEPVVSNFQASKGCQIPQRNARTCHVVFGKIKLPLRTTNGTRATMNITDVMCLLIIFWNNIHKPEC